MENVVAFNNELSSLYESKPPISKAKMASITKAAMRAIKFYKHVVQSVEKFILKCKPEYKVPGLYVIDSIVRQSRHQYGTDKDVFAPRFARNIKETFANLFRCSPEDKSRIIRVLNLWQKNNVFAPEVIQPIFDLAATPNHPIYQLPPGNSGPSGSGGIGDLSVSSANGLNTSSVVDLNVSGGSGGVPGHIGLSDEKLGAIPDFSNNNIKQLLNDPNVLRQLQTLQNLQKFKQQEEKHKFCEMRLQEEAFEKQLQSVLKNAGPLGVGQDAADISKEVEFISEEQKIEVINLDGNDSRSPTPDRHKRRRSSRSRSRSRGRDRRGRRSRSRSRTISPRSNRRSSRDRSMRDREREREHERERRKKGLPDIRKEHLSVCSTTLWVGHLSKLVYQEELSDTFGEYGDIVSIDQIVPRGCAFIVMNRRQDAHKAMQALKNHKLQGRAITISWAAGKGVKSKEWKDFWDLELGVTYIPWNKLNQEIDFDGLEEGGMFDEDSMPGWMKDKINHLKSLKEKANESVPLPVPNIPPPNNMPGNMLFGIDTTQPPPAPPSMMPMVPGQFSMAPPMGGPPRMLGPMGMSIPTSGMPMAPNLVPGMPPPHSMMAPLGIMPPGFPPMPGQMGTPAHMGLTPGGTQFPPPPVPVGGLHPPAAAPVSAPNNTQAVDDHMDIEMEDAEEQSPVSLTPTPVPGPSNVPASFNQPPPLFCNSIPGQNTENITEPPFTRDRGRGMGNNTRWSGRSSGTGDEISNETGGPLPVPRWREGNGPNGIPNFSDIRGPRGPMQIPQMDMNNTQQPRPEYISDFDGRGPRGPRGGNHNVDFFPGMQNRFSQPTSLMQMRIPPPNPFNPRMPGGGPPMFMRGGPAGPGNRPQGPGGFFNPRNPFDRDVGLMPNQRGGGRGGGGRVGRGGRGNGGPMGGGNSHGGGNWSDEEVDDHFKRRGGGNRFRDRGNDGSDDRFNRGDRNSNNWHGRSSPLRDRSGGDHERERERDRNSDTRRQPQRDGRINKFNNDKKSNRKSDTEEDWDLELEEYDTRKETKPMPSETETVEKKKPSDVIESGQNKKPQPTNSHDETQEKTDTATEPAGSSLYDELPAPVTTTEVKQSPKAETADEVPKTYDAVVDVPPVAGKDEVISETIEKPSIDVSVEDTEGKED